MTSMQTIAILNSKGGSGKTTISITLASYYALTGHKTVIIDYDSQGSSTHWVNSRSEEQAHIHNIPAYKLPIGSTQSFHMKLDAGTERVIIDTPGAILFPQLEKIVKRTDFIIIPVQPSSIDIHAVTDFVTNLKRIRHVQWGKTKIAVVANRIKADTGIFSDLIQLLEKLNIPFLSEIHDSENYLDATNEAKGIFEVQPHIKVAQDQSNWHPIINWLEQSDVFSMVTTINHSTETHNTKEIDAESLSPEITDTKSIMPETSAWTRNLVYNMISDSTD